MASQNPWHVKSQNRDGKQKKKSNKTKQNPTPKTDVTGLKKFEEVHNKNVEKAKVYTEQYESSSEEDELDSGEIINKVFGGYAAERNQLSKIQDFVENFLQSGSVVCLICIGTIKRSDAIWSCKNCYCFFHLQCIKRWGNDSIAQQKIHADQEQGYYNNLGEYIPKKIKSIKWCCPKCRKDYLPEEVPTKYMCFCEKEINPPNHPWIIPHSCGEPCENYLKPNCGHRCSLLCHPGSCPPCPQIIFTSCKCGASNPKSIRCFQKTWSCEQKCGRLLSCGIHKCEAICHEKDQCPPCTKKSKQACVCGNETSERNCSQLEWHCKKECKKPLTCGLHKCKKVCHSGDCGDCPLGLPRSCPCGKTQTVAPCTEVIDTCGDTCHKQLPCKIHYCAERCHKGECSPCIINTEKKCRCGLHTKELPCSKSFTCETKCKQMRECGKHICNKKCCDGQCPPCDKVCGKTLSCKKHKCKSICHDGPCYPCGLKSQVKCRCGFTSITVPCGREKKTRPPKCSQPCRIPSKCHHQNPHNCHMNECPPCTQKCNLTNDVTNCEHPCEAKCHSAVKVPISDKDQKDANIWEFNYDGFEIKKLPHPECKVKVKVTCIGGHETALWPCWNSKPTSCQRECGRVLKCGNHTCNLICHSVPDINDSNEQEGCMSCQEGCKRLRPEGCTHPCKKPCHIVPCSPCSAIIKTNCHCGLTQVFYKCVDFYTTALSHDDLEEKREKLKSCGNRCIKNYPCGHRCAAICHSGPCPNPDSCRKKVKIYCECKNLKTEISCEKYRSGTTSINCDNVCLAKKEQAERIKKEQEEKQRKIEEEKNRIELEQFEKKFGRKKYRERKVYEEKPKQDNRNMIWIACGCSVAVVSAILAFNYLK